MSRIKIMDLPSDKIVNQGELREVFGGTFTKHRGIDPATATFGAAAGLVIDPCQTIGSLLGGVISSASGMLGVVMVASGKSFSTRVSMAPDDRRG